MTTTAVIDRRRSGDFTQVSVYLPKKIHKKLKAAAALKDLTMSEFVEWAIIKAIEESE